MIRPRGDGADGEAPTDWEEIHGLFYPTSIVPWLAKMSHALTSALEDAAVMAEQISKKEQGNAV